MHRDMFKIQDGVAIVEKLNCKMSTVYNIPSGGATYETDLT